MGSDLAGWLVFVFVLFLVYQFSVRNANVRQKTQITSKQNHRYEELLNDPRWIAKRQEILARDNNECIWCHSTKNLQVHHKYYKWKNGDFIAPWDYPDNALMTLCENCHKKAHKKRKPPIVFS